MCGSNDPQSCYKEHHEDTTIASHSDSSSSSSVEKVWKETQQLMEDSEQLVRVITHVCSQQFSGVYRTLARYSQGCWRGCDAEENGEGVRRGSCHYANPPFSHQPSCFASSSCQQMSSSCESCVASGCNNPHHLSHLKQQQQQQHLYEESTAAACSCRWRGGWGRRWRWRWGRCQSAHCHQGCSCTMMDCRGCAGPPSSSATTQNTTIVITSNNHQYPPCPNARSRCHTLSPPSSPPHRAPPPASASPKSRSGLPSHPSLLTIILLLVVTLARFTDGCSSRSTPKPRPASPTMRPNITFQTYACPPAYAAWYCLNGATCFTVKIGESILYNCECADGYMGQRCEFKDLDGSYLPAREKVLLETASIAGGATVACVLVFIVLFAVYIFMQKDKDKRCRDIDGGRENDRQPFSGYQNPRPEIFRTITNPYARTIDQELSHVEVQSSGHGNVSGKNTTGGGNDGNARGSMVDSNLQGAQQAS